MYQISIYKRTTKFANVPIPSIGAAFMQNVTQVPSEVMYLIRNFARGATTIQHCREWRWEWQKVGSAA